MKRLRSLGRISQRELKVVRNLSASRSLVIRNLTKRIERHQKVEKNLFQQTKNLTKRIERTSAAVDEAKSWSMRNLTKRIESFIVDQRQHGFHSI